MGGSEALTCLGTLPGKETGGVVALTERVMAGDRSRIRETAFDGFTGRPLCIDTL